MKEVGRGISLRVLPEVFDEANVDESVLGRVAATIDKGEPVLVSLDIDARFTDVASGVISETYVSKPRTPSNGGGHQMLIVGYEMDAAGRVVTLVVQNSWGAAEGAGGFFAVTRDYFVKRETLCYLQ